ncbi:MAG: AEC family transporter, partial [Eubacterium sp.]|nr:AEC family transporter [Eubacterium sp.]
TVLLCANNVGFMGFAVAKAVFNDRILFFAVIFNILASIHVFAVTPLQMQYGSNEPVKRGNILASLLNLPIIATFTGLFFLFTPLSLPKFVFDTFDLLGSANLPLSMIIIGIQLGGSNLMKVIKNYKLTIAALIKVIVMPLIIFLATLPMPISSEMKLTLVFLNALPSAVVEAAIAEENGKNYRLLAEGIMLTTAISIITLPIICSLIGSYYGIV